MKRWNCLLLLATLFAGCGRAQINVYQVPKTKVARENPVAESVPGREADWVTPLGWQELPGDGMRLATFKFTGNEDQKLQVTVVPIAGTAGTLPDNVNRWRSQISLAPLEPASIAGQVTPVEVGSAQGQLYETVSTEPLSGEKYPTRIIVATFARNNTAWFFKMIGDDALVTGQKPAFLTFLKSISLKQSAATPDLASIHQGFGRREEPAVPAADTAGHPAWQVPATWQPAPASPVLVAKFVVPGVRDAKAEVNISSSPGDGGGVPANINRWRGQLGLATVTDQPGLDKLVSSIDIPGAKGLLVDMSGTNKQSGKPARLVAVIVAVGQQTWFNKLMGDASVVGNETAAFLQFVKTTKYSNAP